MADSDEKIHTHTSNNGDHSTANLELRSGTGVLSGRRSGVGRGRFVSGVRGGVDSRGVSGSSGDTSVTSGSLSHKK